MIKKYQEYLNTKILFLHFVCRTFNFFNKIQIIINKDNTKDNIDKYILTAWIKKNHGLPKLLSESTFYNNVHILS